MSSAMQIRAAARTDLPRPGINAASNCSARGQERTSMIRKEEIEQTKADDRSIGAPGPLLGRCPDC